MLKTSKASKSLSEKLALMVGVEECGRWIRAMACDGEEETVGILESALRGGRVNPPHAFPVLYACEGKANTLAQIGRSLEQDDGRVPAIVVAEIEVDLSRVLHLTDAKVRATLDITVAELTDARDLSVPQSVGAAAYRAGFQGVIYPRPLGGRARNLAVFLDRIQADDLRVIRATYLD